MNLRIPAAGQRWTPCNSPEGTTSPRGSAKRTEAGARCEGPRKSGWALLVANAVWYSGSEQELAT